MNDFRERLLDLRTEKGIGQEALAKAIGVSKGIISLWETGKREPSSSNLLLLAKYFNVTSDFLLGIEKDI